MGVFRVGYSTKLKSKCARSVVLDISSPGDPYACKDIGLLTPHQRDLQRSYTIEEQTLL